VPSSLKAWIDHVVREGRTYSLSNRKPQGLLKCQKAFVVVSRMETPFYDAGGGLDHQESYLRQILGLIGIFSIDVVRVEAFGTESARRVTVASANTQVHGLLREFAQHLA
jgi:FMN-dependent NADH-azoreductase